MGKGVAARRDNFDVTHAFPLTSSPQSKEPVPDRTRKDYRLTNALFADD